LQKSVTAASEEAIPLHNLRLYWRLRLQPHVTKPLADHQLCCDESVGARVALVLQGAFACDLGGYRLMAGLWVASV
jgi:hypothetical protein